MFRYGKDEDEFTDARATRLILLCIFVCGLFILAWAFLYGISIKYFG